MAQILLRICARALLLLSRPDRELVWLVMFERALAPQRSSNPGQLVVYLTFQVCGLEATELST